MEISIKTDYIKVSQLLKLANITSQGSDIKILIGDECVYLNEKLITERGKKVYKGDIVKVNINNTCEEIKVI